MKTQAAEEEAAESADLAEVKSLEAFFVTPGSELAMSALRHVAARKKPDLNPLVVFGPEGSRQDAPGGRASRSPAGSCASTG